MTQTRLFSPGGRLLPLVAIVVVLAATVVLSANTANAQTEECVATGVTLKEAKAAYAGTCTAPRVDCDPIDSGWECSNRVIGNAAPGGVTPTNPDPAPEPAPTAPAPDVTEPAPTPEPTPIPDPVPGPTSIPAQSSPDVLRQAEPTPGAVLTLEQPDAAALAPDSSTSEAPTSEAPTPEAPTQDAALQEEPAPDEPAPDETVPDALAPAVIAPGNSVVIERSFPATDGPDRNPMKGWNSGWSDDRPESTVGFQYIKWSDLEPSNGEFNFAAVENIINRPGSRDRHLILRLYCDWQGASEASHGCPDWIYSEVGVDRIEGDNGRYITDYNDPRYLDEATQAIQALGDRYDNDPRIYSFQLGVIGYWGEWHTWGSQVDGSPYEISRTTEQRILDAYDAAFERALVMGRYPDRSTLADTGAIGFHNDYFRPNNDHSAQFDTTVSTGAHWLDGAIGGEMPPGLSRHDYFDFYATSQGQEMIESGHYSTMKPSTVDNQHADSHLDLHRRFGYNYRIDKALFVESQVRSDEMNVALSVTNIGVAPFYYDWQVQFALLAGDGTPVATADASSYDLRNAAPDTDFTLTGAVPLRGVDSGDYRLAVRILQPGADRPKATPWGLAARNTYVLFANDLPVVDGTWGDANELVGGWSVLGETSVD